MDGMTLRLAARCQDQNKASSNKSISVTQDPGTGKMTELNVNKLCCHLLLMTIFHARAQYMGKTKSETFKSILYSSRSCNNAYTSTVRKHKF